MPRTTSEQQLPPTVERAVRLQLVTAGYIERFWDNLIKVGKDKITRVYCQTRLDLLESYWKRFTDNHLEIVACDGIEELEYIKRDMYTTTESQYVEMKSRIVSHLSTSSTAEATKERSAGEAVLRQFQLPKINLPTFDGDQLAWEGFRDLFRTLVGEGLAPTQKLQYLKASLTGEAALAVSNVEISADGYAQAWEELTIRYDNPRVLLTTHMRTLLACPPVTKPSAPEITRLVSAVSQGARSFESLKRRSVG